MDKFTRIVENPDTGSQVLFIDSRYYQKNDKWFPGISTILDVVSKGKEYDKWLKSVGMNADYISRQAMDSGSKIHSAIEQLLKGEEVIFGTMENGAFYSRDEWVKISKFMDFYTEFKPETIAIEKVLVSEKLGFGSQIDYVCKLNGKIIIVDHKSGGIYDSALLQLGAYVKLWEEFYPKMKIDGAAVLHLDSTHRGRDSKGKEIQGRGWKLQFIEELDKQWDDFTHVLAIWKRKNPDYKPFNSEYPASYKL
jgi:hypothetical protein